MLMVLRSIWPRHTVDELAVEVWAQAMRDVDFRQAQAAIDVITRESEWFPTPAKILQTISHLAGDAMPVPDLAWEEVMREVSRVGLDPKPQLTRDGQWLPALKRTFSHPVIEDAVRAVGWRVICLSDNESHARREFIRALTNLIERQERERSLAATSALPDRTASALAAGRR